MFAELGIRTIAVEEEDLAAVSTCASITIISATYIELVNKGVNTGLIASQVFGSGHFGQSSPVRSKRLCSSQRVLVDQCLPRRCAKEPGGSMQSTDKQHPNVVGCFFWLAGVLAGHFWPKMESLRCRASDFEWPASPDETLLPPLLMNRIPYKLYCTVHFMT